MSDNDRELWDNEGKARHYGRGGRPSGERSGYRVNSDYEGDGTIAWRGFGNERSGYDPDRRNGWYGEVIGMIAIAIGAVPMIIFMTSRGTCLHAAQEVMAAFTKDLPM